MLAASRVAASTTTTLGGRERYQRQRLADVGQVIRSRFTAKGR
jgi:hypothetical protein